MASLRDQTRLYGLRKSHSHTLVEGAAEHRRMLEEILAGRRDQVAKLLTVHLGHVRSEWANPSTEER